VTLEDPVIKDKIDEVVCIPNQNPLLAGFKAESVAQLQQKVLKFIKELLMTLWISSNA